MASPSDPSSPSGLDRSAAEPARENDLAASFADLVRRHLPNWSGVGDPRFVEEEVEYKRAAAARIQELLAEETLRDLVARERFAQVIDRVKKAAQATNLLFRGVPSSGDLAVLNADGLDPASFSAALLDLLYGDGASPERLERFSSYLDEHSLPNKWALPTYLLFFLFPRTEMFVKPQATQWLLRQAGVDASYTSRPSGEVYAQILALANEILAGLEPLGARDMIDVQSVVWVAYWVSSEVEELAPSDAKRREMELLFEECAREYLPTPEGRRHLAAYEEGRERARASWAEIVAARDAGEDVTDRVLRELLPYTDSAANREAGAWVHVAPAITGDLRNWFEAKGWQKPDDWQRVAEAIVDFVERAVDDPNALEAACREFDALPWSTGFQTGMLTPLLNALSPDHFLLVNNKSRRLINYLAGTKLSHKLLDYPELNRTGKILIEHLADLLESAPASEPAPDPEEPRTDDVFDGFAHWLVSIRNFTFGDTQDWKLAPEEETGNGGPRTGPKINPPFPIADCATALKMDAAEIERWVRAIERKMQAILYGPPGTGKTYAAEHLARHLIGGDDGFRDLVQFHPSYAYEDFIQGIRPEALADGGLHYPIRRGRFLEFCDEARKREGRCVLIVDEINRANLSRVFGELMYLLENRDRAIPLAAGGESFSIPENVRILGTMNTADRSIALVDHALRRRFAFLELRPSYETLVRFHEGGEYDARPLVALLEEVNRAIDDPHYEVGITYFLHKSLPDHLEDVWRMEIVPYLEEYFSDRRDVVERFRWPSVRERFSG